MDYAAITQLIKDNLPDGGVILAAKHREVEQAILDFIQTNVAQSGDIKRIKANLAYITANFETNGLGKNLRLGWAICNGNNDTDNLAGKVGIGYGIGFTGLGDSIGSADSVLIEHGHDLRSTNWTNTNCDGLPLANSVAGRITTGTAYYTNTVDGFPFVKKAGAAGETGVGKNYQPSIINLYIMKI
jgi:hypothetical protein